jgi:cytochrome c oxidase cbb3-type subunit III
MKRKLLINNLMKKVILPIVLMLAGFSASAQNSTDEVMAFMDNLLITITVVLLMVLILVAVAMLKMFDYVKKNDSEDEANEVSIWERLLSLKPLSAEKDIELDHNYDDIKELNNPIPPWFNVLFYGTIVFGLAYIFVFHVFQVNPLQAEEYKTELIIAEKQKQEYLKKMDNLVNEDNVTITEDKSKLAQGAEVFKTKCVVCHGEKAEGKNGPNLTDVYWLHGGDIKAVFKTISNGVTSKGMPAWKNNFPPAQIQSIASYILSLQGSNPAGAKAAEGMEFISKSDTSNQVKISAKLN